MALAAGEVLSGGVVRDASGRQVIAVDSSSAGVLTVENVNTVAASGAAQTLPDVTTATLHRITLTANCTITLPTPAAGESLTVVTVQDGTGGRMITWATPSGAVKWPGGATPTYSPAAAAIDVTTFVCADGANWLGMPAGYAFS